MATRQAPGLTSEPKPLTEKEKEETRKREMMPPEVMAAMERAGKTKAEWEESYELGRKKFKDHLESLTAAFNDRFSLSGKDRKAVEKRMQEHKQRQEAADLFNKNMEALFSQYTHNVFFYTKGEDGPYHEAIAALMGVPVLGEDEASDGHAMLIPNHPSTILRCGKNYRHQNGICFDVVFAPLDGEETLEVTVVKVKASDTRMPTSKKGRCLSFSVWGAEANLADKQRREDTRAEDGDAAPAPVGKSPSSNRKTAVVIKDSWKQFPSGSFVEAYLELTGQTAKADGSFTMLAKFNDQTKEFMSDWYVDGSGRHGYDCHFRDSATGNTLTGFFYETDGEDHEDEDPDSPSSSHFH